MRVYISTPTLLRTYWDEEDVNEIANGIRSDLDEIFQNEVEFVIPKVPIGPPWKDLGYEDDHLESDADEIMYISKCIETMSDIDLIYFDGDWQNSRKCRIEEMVARLYNIEIYRKTDDQHPSEDLSDYIKTNSTCTTCTIPRNLKKDIVSSGAVFKVESFLGLSKDVDHIVNTYSDHFQRLVSEIDPDKVPARKRKMQKTNQYNNWHLMPYDSDMRGSWEKVDTLPFPFHQGSVVMYHDEIHALGSYGGTQDYHYKWDGKKWIKVSNIPFPFYNGSAVVYNDEIHILGSCICWPDDKDLGSKHYKWDGKEWSEVSKLPKSFSGGVSLVHNGELHSFRRNLFEEEDAHFHFVNGKWINESTEFDRDLHPIAAVSYNNDIHIFSMLYTNGPYFDVLKYNIIDKIYGDDIKDSIVSAMPKAMFYHSSIVVYDNKIHVLGSNLKVAAKHHHIWDGKSWTTIDDMPYMFGCGSAIAAKDGIHILGGSGSSRSHYKWTNKS